MCAQKVGARIVIGRYGYKSSFGANNENAKMPGGERIISVKSSSKSLNSFWYKMPRCGITHILIKPTAWSDLLSPLLQMSSLSLNLCQNCFFKLPEGQTNNFTRGIKLEIESLQAYRSLVSIG